MLCYAMLCYAMLCTTEQIIPLFDSIYYIEQRGEEKRIRCVCPELAILSCLRSEKKGQMEREKSIPSLLYPFLLYSTQTSTLTLLTHS